MLTQLLVILAPLLWLTVTGAGPSRHAAPQPTRDAADERPPANRLTASGRS